MSRTLRTFLLFLSLTLSSLCAYAAQPVNINTADAVELATLEGVGPVKAQAIVAYREANGRFRTVEQLLAVDGIGEATLERNRPSITLGSEPVAE